MIEKRHLFFMLRQFIYLVGCVATVFFQHFLASKYLDATFHEHGIVENMQLCELILATVLFSCVRIKRADYKKLAPFFAALCAMACCRELDNFLGSTLPIIGWKIGFIFIIIAGWYALKDWKQTCQEVLKFIRHPSLGIMLCAIVLIIPVGQCIGHKSFLINVLQMEHVGRIKELIEESVETVGYFVLLCSAVELLCKDVKAAHTLPKEEKA